MKKNYDLVIMVKSDVKDEVKDKLTGRLEKVVKTLGGVVKKTLEMGKKQMAYKIKGQTEAVYINLVLEMPSEGVVQLEKKLNIDSEILRHLLVAGE